MLCGQLSDPAQVTTFIKIVRYSPHKKVLSVISASKYKTIRFGKKFTTNMYHFPYWLDVFECELVIFVLILVYALEITPGINMT